MKRILLILILIFASSKLMAEPSTEKLFQLNAAPIGSYTEIGDELFANDGVFRWNNTAFEWESMDNLLALNNSIQMAVSINPSGGVRHWIFDSNNARSQYSDDFGENWVDLEEFNEILAGDDVTLNTTTLSDGSLVVIFTIFENFTDYDLVFISHDGENFEEIISHNGYYYGAHLGDDGTIYLIGDNVLKKSPGEEGFVHWDSQYYMQELTTVPGYVVIMNDLNEFKLYDIEEESWSDISEIPSFDYNYESVSEVISLSDGKVLFSTKHYFEPTSKLYSINIKSNLITLVNDDFPYLVQGIFEDSNGNFHIGTPIGDFVAQNPSERFINNSKGLNIMPILAFDIADDNTAYVTTTTGHVFKVSDVDNQDITYPDWKFNSFVPFKDFKVTSDGSLLLINEDGIFRKDAGSDSWEMKFNQGRFGGSSVKFVYGSDGTMYVAESEKLVYSDDEGRSWMTMEPDYDNQINSVNFFNDVLYVGTDNGIIRFDESDEPVVHAFEGYSIVDFVFTDAAIVALIMDNENYEIYGAAANLDGNLIQTIKLENFNLFGGIPLFDITLTSKGDIYIATLFGTVSLMYGNDEWSQFLLDGIFITRINEAENGLNIGTIRGEIYNVVTQVSVNNNPVEFENLPYPNPANDLVTLNLDHEFTNDVTISVYDNTGKLVIEEVLRPSNNEVQLDTSSLQNGSYQYIIRSGANYSIGKFMVSK